MYVGSLKQVMTEDSQSAYKSRIRNRAYKDPNTTLGVVYNGSMADYENQSKKMMPPSVASKYTKTLQKDQEKEIEYRSKLNKSMGKAETRDKIEQKYKNEKNQIQPTAGVTDSKTKIVGANINAHPQMNMTNNQGNINWNHPLAKHERQHAIQNQIIDDYAKSKNKKNPDTLLTKYENESERIKQIGDKYPHSAVSSTHYVSSPKEFDANRAAVKQQNSAGSGTIRASLQSVGAWPGRQFKPDPIDARTLAKRANGINPTPGQRRMDRRIYANQYSLPMEYRTEYLQAPNKPSTTPLPQKTQEFVEKESNKINKQIQNGRTFTNKDLENAQPLRQNPIPRKQR